MSDYNIPEVDLTDEQKSIHFDILVAGNTVLKEVHEEALEKKLPHTKNRFEFRNHLLDLSGGEKQDMRLKSMTVSKSALDKIQAVKDLDCEIVSGYSKMIKQISNRWNKKKNSVLDFDDLMQEGMFSLLKASVYFLGHTEKGKVCFTTYLWRSVNHRMMTVCLHDRSIKTSKPSFDLSREFEKTKKEHNGPCNFDEIIEKMDLTEIQKYNLIQERVVIV
ncbi:MAG: hypothetical protein ACW987_00005, partial [Candidatus Thorarchaeota archaeon]